MDWREWRNWSRRRRWITGAVVVLVVLIVIGALTEQHKKANVTDAAKASSTTTSASATATTKPITASSQAPKPKSAPKPRPYTRPASFFIDVTASVAGSHIEVGGKTNLPDGTVLTINAERAFKQTHEGVRIDFLGLNGPTSANVSVHDAHFSGVLSSLEHNLATGLQGDPGGPVATIDPDAEVCVVLYTGRGSSINGPFVQPPQVRADIGTYGTNRT